MNEDLVQYYAQRAKEYDTIYAIPERQAAIEMLGARLQSAMKGRRVLELACGTGFWTEKIAKTARSIVATDINGSVLEIARNRCLGFENVSFDTEDVYNPVVHGEFDAVFAGFLWSHVQKAKLPGLLAVLHTRLPKGGLVVMADNRFLPGVSTPIGVPDGDGDTYQVRTLSDGSTHRVLKNFPLKTDFETLLKGYTFELSDFEYYWLLQYRV